MIIALLLLNATVGFVQEYQAGSIVDELKKTLALKAIVLREARLQEIDAPAIVPGDVLQIEEVSSATPPVYKGGSKLTRRQGNHHPRRRPHCHRRCLPASRSIRHYW